MKRLVVALSFVALLSACGGTAKSDAKPTKSEITSSGPQTFATANDVYEAVLAADVPCEDWTQVDYRPHSMVAAADWGWCGADVTISTYASAGDLETDLAADRAFRESIKEINEDTEQSPVLVGPNWMITSDNAAELQKKLGGVIQR